MCEKIDRAGAYLNDPNLAEDIIDHSHRKLGKGAGAVSAAILRASMFIICPGDDIAAAVIFASDATSHQEVALLYDSPKVKRSVSIYDSDLEKEIELVIDDVDPLLPS